MNIELKFDYYSRMIYIPDGHVYDMKILQSSFLEWMQQQPECIVSAPNMQLGFSYNEEDFLRFINSVVLKNSKEKAYFISKPQKKIKKRFVIVF